MFRKAIAIAVLVTTPMAVQADVEIGSQVITTGSEIKVLEPGPDLQMIINEIIEIGDAGPGKPYLIKLGPGEYTLTAALVMAPHISVMGSGQGVTILKGAISSDDFTLSAIVSCASDTVLNDLSVTNAGAGGSISSAVYCSGSSPRIERVTATASGAHTNFGVLNDSSSPTMTAVTATASGGSTSNTGVYNLGSSSPTMTAVTATASGGTGANYGVFNDSSSPTMTEVTASASGGTFQYGVFNSSPISAPQIRSSFLSGANNAMRFNGSTGTRISDSQLVGGYDSDPTGVQCRNTYDASLTDITC